MPFHMISHSLGICIIKLKSCIIKYSSTLPHLCRMLAMLNTVIIPSARQHTTVDISSSFTEYSMLTCATLTENFTTACNTHIFGNSSKPECAWPFLPDISSERNLEHIDTVYPQLKLSKVCRKKNLWQHKSWG